MPQSSEREWRAAGLWNFWGEALPWNGPKMELLSSDLFTFALVAVVDRGSRSIIDMDLGDD